MKSYFLVSILFTSPAGDAETTLAERYATRAKCEAAAGRISLAGQNQAFAALLNSSRFEKFQIGCKQRVPAKSV